MCVVTLTPARRTVNSPSMQSTPSPVQTHMRGFCFVYLLLTLACLSGCETFGSQGKATMGQAGPIQASHVTANAKRTYFEGMQDLIAGNYNQAVQRFSQVARSPRYVHYAALARLRMGDAYFMQERYEEAQATYRAFVSQYQSDANLPYARFRIAACYYERLPQEWFFSVPAHEIDQTITRESIRELGEFLSTFPTTRFAEEARGMLDTARRLLFDHEMFVANYYAERDKWRAVAWRIDGAVRDFPDLAITSENIWRMGDAYDKASDARDAQRAYGLYLEHFPEGAHHELVRERLEALEVSEDNVE